MNYYGNAIRMAREQRKISQKVLAITCKMKQQYISNLENNTKRASDKILLRISKGVNMSLEELKNLDSLVQHNSEQQGGNAANVIIQHGDSDIHTALQRAYSEIDYWKTKAVENEDWKQRAIKAELQLEMAPK